MQHNTWPVCKYVWMRINYFRVCGPNQLLTWIREFINSVRKQTERVELNNGVLYLSRANYQSKNIKSLLWLCKCCSCHCKVSLLIANDTLQYFVSLLISNDTKYSYHIQWNLFPVAQICIITDYLMLIYYNRLITVYEIKWQ